MTRLPGRLAHWALLGVLTLIASPVLAEPDVAASPAKAVSYSVDIEAPEDLVAVLRENLDIVVWSGREDVSEDQLRQLVRTAPDQVIRLLATEGYFTPDVKITIDKLETGPLVRLQVQAGEPTRVVSVDFRIAGAIESDPDRDQRISDARNAFTLNKGMIFRQPAWDASKEGVTHSLHRRRYAAARVTNSRAEIDPKTHEARLSVEIDSGPRFYFGDVEVNGLQRYPLSTVRNFSPIQPGDPYDEAQLLKFQKRLLGSGRFASAVVWAGTNPENAMATPIYVNIVESAARKVELGVGYSTNRGPRAEAGYTDFNALDRALKFDTRVEIDRLIQQVSGGIALPRNVKGWVYGVQAKYAQEDIQSVERQDWSVTGTHTYAVEEYKSQQILQLITENRRLADLSEDSVVALYLAQNWNWSGLDNMLAPRDGYFVGLEVGGASRDVISNATFGRMVAKGHYYQPVSTFGTLSFRLEGGTVFADSRKNIPSAYLFRTGGDTTVRGYAFESLGVEADGAVVGGRYLLVGSVEYVQWITEQFGAAIFYDAGNAVDDRSEYRAAAGYGVGVRWYSPIGAINLDVAYGEERDDYRIHFTAGYVFQ